jgi:hypothetical protein
MLFKSPIGYPTRMATIGGGSALGGKLAKVAEERATGREKLIAMCLDAKTRAVTDPLKQLERSEAMERMERLLRPTKERFEHGGNHGRH